MSAELQIDDLAALRRRWAKQTTAIAGVVDPAVEAAFAATARETFLPPPPWTIFGGRRGRTTTSDPRDLYDDVLVALDPARGVNNGSPTLHAAWLGELRVRAGDRIAHFGAGTGHYSAILARLAGPAGRVEAVEIDPRLAALAARALGGLPPGETAPIDVVVADAATRPVRDVDRIYVNFGVAAPARPWLDRLTIGGRLILPLCVPVDGGGGWESGEGHGLLVERRGDGFAARLLDGCAFVFAEGSASVSQRAVAGLRAAFRAGGGRRVRSLVLGPVSDRRRCWYVGDDWALSIDPPGAPSPTVETPP